MDEHKKYLADRLLSEEQPITYRLLSRALDVHVNTAKEMLYDFHASQNAQKANSIHATYLVYGTKLNQDFQKDEDVEMEDSKPEHEPLSEQVPTIELMLIREENLTAVLSGFQEVHSIHIYSLAPFSQNDLSLLSDVTKSLSEYKAKDDPAKAAQRYGIIGNPNARRRDRHGRPNAPTSSASKPTKTTATPAIKTEQTAKPALVKTEVKPKKEPMEERLSKDVTPSSTAKKATPSLKRGASGGIMESFAKAASNSKILKKEPKEEESSMALSDDGEADDDDDVVPAKRIARDDDEVRKSRKQREEELRRMMEEDDDEESDEEKEKSEDEEMEEAPEPEPEPEPEEAKPKKEEPSEVVSSSENGRRRGKRRVMQKKRILDDDGFMVTIQEQGWESFSEDEAPPPTKKETPSSTPSSSGGKAKKAAGKGAQGNIMSFFAKK